MIIYKSDKLHEYTGDSKISVYVQNGINLPNADSLLQLVDLYDVISNPSPYTQSILEIYKDELPCSVFSSPSFLNKIRSFFSTKFYIYDERKTDLDEFRSKSSEYVEICKYSTDNLIHNPDIEVKITYGQPSLTYQQLKDSIKSLLSGMNRNITISFISSDTIDGGTDGPVSGPKKTEKTIITIPFEDIDSGPDPEPREYLTDVKTPKDVTTSKIELAKGNPNVFFWNVDEGMTYDFSLKCEKNCINSLSVTENGVENGRIEVPATWAESTEKEYKATLVIKFGGKVLKTISKKVKLVCS